MAKDRLSGTLAVILHADVAGSTALVQQDKELAHARIQDSFRRLSKTIEKYQGHVLELRGDALLADFERASESVSAALSFQVDQAKYNDLLADDLRPTIRIGIAMGEVVFADSTVTGAGVVQAQRVEQLADQGGVCITAAIHEALSKRLPLDLENLGEQVLKGFDHPVHVYRVEIKAEHSVPSPEQSIKRQTAPKKSKFAVAATAMALILIGGVYLWSQTREPREEPALVEKMVQPLPGRPSIAVLPFSNFSNDPKQEYFSDGMTEDLVTDLSRLPSLRVIPRSSTAGYKGRQVNVREVGEALGVRYVIEGSVRRAGNQVRINVQLIDATTGSQMWADRYDGILDDIFKLQDRVLGQIVEAMALKLSEQDRRRLSARGTRSIAAHELYLQGLFEESKFTREGNREAVLSYEQALSIDPNYPLPYSRLSQILQYNIRSGWTEDIHADLDMAVDLAEKAISLDPDNPMLYWILSRALSRIHAPGMLQRGIEAMERAIELDPYFADAYAFLGNLYTGSGRIQEGLRSIETAMKLNPRYPFWYLFMRAMNRYFVEDYEAAIADLEAAVQRNPNAQFLRWWLAVSYAGVGNMDDAEWQIDELFGMGFEGNIESITKTQPIQHPPYLEKYTAALRQVGIPN